MTEPWGRTVSKECSVHLRGPRYLWATQYFNESTQCPTLSKTCALHISEHGVQESPWATRAISMKGVRWQYGMLPTSVVLTLQAYRREELWRNGFSPRRRQKIPKTAWVLQNPHQSNADTKETHRSKDSRCVPRQNCQIPACSPSWEATGMTFPAAEAKGQAWTIRSWGVGLLEVFWDQPPTLYI